MTEWVGDGFQKGAILTSHYTVYGRWVYEVLDKVKGSRAITKDFRDHESAGAYLMLQSMKTYPEGWVLRAVLVRVDKRELWRGSLRAGTTDETTVITRVGDGRDWHGQ